MEESKKREIAEASQLYQALPDPEYLAVIQGMIRDCETLESLKKVEAFQRLQAQMNEVCRRA